jgi:hypothetical protein
MTRPLRGIIVFATVLAFVLLADGWHRAYPQGEHARVDIENLFTPSGWMGDAEYDRKYVDFSGDDLTSPNIRPKSIKITYLFGPKRWAGMYWQNQPDNWGDEPGNNYSSRKLSSAIFWARGATGGEVVEFKVGGINDPRKGYRDSVAATTGRIPLTKEWKQYKIDLEGADLSDLIGGFCWVASADYNNGGKITFYLDDITLQ